MDEKSPAKPGRPSKFREEYCEMLIQHMAMGMTYTSFAGHPDVRVNVDTLYQWEKDNPQFSEAKSIAKPASEYYMLELAHSQMIDGKMNNTAWVFMMKNMHGWRDKQEQVGETNHKITLNYKLDD